MICKDSYSIYDSKPFHKTNVTSFNKRKTVRKLTTPYIIQTITSVVKN